MLFPLGRTVATPAAIEDILDAGLIVEEIIAKHMILEAGELDEDDQQLNRDAVESGGRILSCFKLNTGINIYVITEANRSATTVLRRDEY